MRGTIISGTVRLLQGEVAPTGGLQLIVRASGAGFGTSTLRVIPAGADSIGYEIAVTQGARVRISYVLQMTTFRWATSGFYNSAGTTAYGNLAQDLVVGNAPLTSIDLELLRGVAVSGTVRLHQGEVAPIGGLHLWVRAEVGGSVNGSSSVVIPVGADRASFVLAAPQGTQVRISYQLQTTYPGLLPQGFYTAAGTVADRGLAPEIAVGTEPITGIDLEILRATTISGTLRLPQGETAPEGLQLSVHATGTGVSVSTSVAIVPGGGAVDYALTLPLGARVRIHYAIQGEHSRWVRHGYYSATGTTTSRSAAQELTVGVDPLTDIDLEILPGVVISGTVEARNLGDFAGIQFVLTFDPAVLRLIPQGVTGLPGAILVVNEDRSHLGEVTVALVTTEQQPLDFTICQLTFEVVGGDHTTTTPVTIRPLKGAFVTDRNAQPVWVTVEQGEVSVRVMFGDVNDDGYVDVGDAVQMLRAIVGLRELTSRESLIADVDGNGQVDIADVILVLQHVVGNIRRFPVEKD